MMRRLPVLLALVLAALAAGPASAQAGQMLWFDEDGSEQMTYSPGSPIVVYLGNNDFVGSCPMEGGVRDSFNVAMKLYIVPAGAQVGQKLADVGNAPNVMISSGTSGWIDEFIGVAGVGVPTGVYDVVYDECEDGTIQDHDAIFRDAITVTAPAPGAIPSLSPAIAKVKADARAQADGWKKTLFAWTALNTALDAYEQASCIMDVVDCFLGPDALLGYFVSGVQNALGVEDPKEPATNVPVNTVGHYQGIANAPPDPTFTSATGLPPVPVIDPRSSDP